MYSIVFHRKKTRFHSSGKTTGACSPAKLSSSWKGLMDKRTQNSVPEASKRPTYYSKILTWTTQRLQNVKLGENHVPSADLETASVHFVPFLTLSAILAKIYIGLSLPQAPCVWWCSSWNKNGSRHALFSSTLGINHPVRSFFGQTPLVNSPCLSTFNSAYFCWLHFYLI